MISHNGQRKLRGHTLHFGQMFHNLINHLLLEHMFVVTSVDVFILPPSCCFQHFLKMKAKQEPNVEDIALGSLFR